jgi:hypothetical protein
VHCRSFVLQAASPRPQELVFPPVLPPELMPFPYLARHMTARLEDYMRVVEQRRLAQMNRGASQDTIERYTFPHKYKQVSRKAHNSDYMYLQNNQDFEAFHYHFLLST